MKLRVGLAAGAIVLIGLAAAYLGLPPDPHVAEPTDAPAPPAEGEGELPKFQRSAKRFVREARAKKARSGQPSTKRTVPLKLRGPGERAAEAGGTEDGPAGPVELVEPEENLSSTWPLTKEGIDNAMFERLEDIRSCYQQALTGDQELEGKVAVLFTIQDHASGDEAYVHQVETESADLVDQVMMRGCLATIIEELRFEVSTSGEPTAVRYPFMFSPG